MANTLFDQFKKQMENKGVKLESNDDQKKEKTELLKALEKHIGREQGPQTHSDHGSFTRHGSDAAAVEDKEDKLENHPIPRP